MQHVLSSFLTNAEKRKRKGINKYIERKRLKIIQHPDEQQHQTILTKSKKKGVCGDETIDLRVIKDVNKT